LHRGEFPGSSIERYDASAQETIAIGNRFTYRDRITHERRVGYYDRETARFTAVDPDGFIRTHHLLDEAQVCEMPLSTYRD
jgi:hypothetical protein